MAAKPANSQIADVLDNIANLLEDQDSNPFRVRAYREGARTIRNLDRRVADLTSRGRLDKLTSLPNIGSGIGAVISEYVSSGKSSLLEDLQAQVSPEDVFAKVPGIGEELARRIADELRIETLPELEEAAHDGRLATVEGFGARRVEGVRTALAGMLSRAARTRSLSRTTDETKPVREREERPSVALLLSIDAEYRQRAEAGKLHKIAPRRFNPQNEAWLPILNTKRDGWEFTALYSNTAQAHRLGKTQDWVVVYYEQNGKERQHTIVTEMKGALKGKRVVRGREAENLRYYQASAAR